MFEDNDLREFHAKLDNKPSKTQALIQFKGQKSVSTVLLGALTNFHCTLYKVR